MKIVLTDEQRSLRAMFREVLTDACPPATVRAVKAGTPPDELWRTLAKNGVFGLAVPAEFGGDAASLFELGLLFEAAGRVLCPTEVYSTLIAGVALDRLGDDEMRARYLPRLAAGEVRATTAMWNPADAADVTPAFAARRSAGSWSLSGTAMFVPNADRAEIAVVTAGPHETVAAVIGAAAPGWTTSPLTTIAGDPQSRLELAGATPLGVTSVSGEELRWVANAALSLQCMEMVGGAAAVIDRTVAYVLTREQFGRPLASFQAVHHHVANMRIALDCARITAWHAAWSVGRGDVAQRAVAIAKMHCSEAYKAITLTAHQLHGGMGFVRETDLHLWSERAKVTELQGGTADVAARWLERELEF